VVIMLVGIAYNLLAVATGGLVVEMDSVARQEQGPTTNDSARSP
jgi:hypothetical protein